MYFTFFSFTFLIYVSEQILYNLQKNYFFNQPFRLLDHRLIFSEATLSNGSIVLLRNNQCLYEMFFFDNLVSSKHYFYLYNTSYTNNFHLSIPSCYFFFISLVLQKSLFYTKFSLLDIFFISQSSILYSWCSFFSDTRFFLSPRINNKHLLPSLSSIQSNAVWLEREVLEFNYIFFSSLLDTRRLLSDYTTSLNKSQQPKESWVSYNTLYGDILSN